MICIDTSLRTHNNGIKYADIYLATLRNYLNVYRIQGNGKYKSDNL